MKRRNFVQHSSAAFAGLSLLGLTNCGSSDNKSTEQNSSETENALFFKLSLAQWSLHSQIKNGTLQHIEFAEKASEFGVDGLEYVSQLFPNEKFTDELIKEMNLRAEGEGLANHLIMIDHNGDLGINDSNERQQAINNHKQWIDAAAALHCQSIRVNMAGDGTNEEIIMAGTESLSALSEYAAQYNINILVENHGGFSSNIDELVKIFQQVNLPNCGALPDFGNWCIQKGKDEEGKEKCINEYDRYKGVKLLMPHAKGGVSAKAKKFDENGNELTTDYTQMLKIVKDTGFKGYIGIEYENDDADMEDKGIRMTRELLIREGKKLI